ncbi:MAG: hypothetical protein CMJ89_10205 [Planctomycetes bacterium]|nr:hypothetical protein [Planctomycetota bacterium]
MSRNRFLLLTALLASLPVSAQQTDWASSSPSELDPGAFALAGKRLLAYPYFQYVNTFNEGDPIQVALDPGVFPTLRQKQVDIYIVTHASTQVGDELFPATDFPKTVVVPLRSVKDGIFTIDPGTLAGATGTTSIGTAYDVIVDINRNSRFDAPDLIDGNAKRAGFYIVADLAAPGPYQGVEELYNGGGFLQQDIYYPDNIASLGELPLIVVSHGNGHDHRWYDHLGSHMSSWGYVVMSHRNNTGPGPGAAATTTLSNTNHLLGNLDTILSGVLDGHIDRDNIVWIGHSRGGEGVVIAYRRLLDGQVFEEFGPEDIKLVSSIAPTDFGGPSTDIGDVPYHLWTGGADNDVNGCAVCNVCQTFHLHERADGERYSISLHGVGHGDFHDGGGPSVAMGPCRVGRLQTHDIMRGYFLPLVKWVLEGDPAAQEFLWRQWEDLRPSGAPLDDCVVVDLMYQEHPASGKFVLDDFQSNPAVDVSSSGGAMLTSLAEVLEGRFDDPNNSFNPSDPLSMNAMTLAGNGDDSSGIVFEWDGADEVLLFQVPQAQRDLSGFAYLSFRAAQAARDPLTTVVLEDLDLSVELIDFDGRSSTIRIGAYGGGIEEPYQRPRCGGMNLRGWANEFETIRVRLEDFRSDGRRLDLTRIAVVGFLFGPGFGSSQGRIGLDEIEFTHE